MAEEVTDPNEFRLLCDAAQVFWSTNTLPAAADDPVILVEAMSQDLRVTLRNLTVANAIRRITPARLVVYTGADDDWNQILWTYFDKDSLTALAGAYGADDVIDIQDIVDARLVPHPPEEITVAGQRIPVKPTSGIDPAVLAENVRATACRIMQEPRLTDRMRSSERFAEVSMRSEAFAHVYDALFAGLNPVALVTSHVDYNHWGLAVDSAQRSDVPVVFVQSTGSLKAYALFPEQHSGMRTFRAELTDLIGEFFEQHVWGNRDLFRASAELTTWRTKGNLNRPSWWRVDDAAIEIQTEGERNAVRAHALRACGFHADRPVVAVYNHAVSDALNTNVEVFDDLAEWFERTADYAAEHPEASWLFLDHPHQHLYDSSGFFESLRARHEGSSHMLFRRSLDFSKNALWSLVDLGVTVRGSISNELPAFGIPAVQAGWSEWSACGFNRIAKDQADYWAILDDCIQGLNRGHRLISDEEVERARLWLWFYRSAADVPTPLVNHWRLGQGDNLYRSLRIQMRCAEPDADPVFSSVRRMWSRHDPFLTRFDLTAGPERLADELGGMSR